VGSNPSAAICVIESGDVILPPVWRALVAAEAAHHLHTFRPQ
jgi:hypothetical protein